MLPPIRTIYILANFHTANVPLSHSGISKWPDRAVQVQSTVSGRNTVILSEQLKMT